MVLYLVFLKKWFKCIRSILGLVDAIWPEHTEHTKKMSSNRCKYALYSVS